MVQNMKRLLPVLVVIFLSQSIFAESLTGFWKHGKQPVWIEITEEDDVIEGTFVRNDVKPERTGNTFLTDVKPIDGKKNEWTALAYTLRLKADYSPIELELLDETTMQFRVQVKVGPVKRRVKVKWHRVDQVPDKVKPETEEVPDGQSGT